MSTMNISLPDSLRSFVDEQVAKRGCGASSEYVRELIRSDQDRQRLRDLLLDGDASPATGQGPASRSRVSPRRVVPREIARRDVGPEIALGFIDALQSADQAIAEGSAAGSPRYAHEPAIPGLRRRALKNDPYLVFYVDRDDRVDVWRVLHARRDIPARMREAERWAIATCSRSSARTALLVRALCS